MTRFTKEQMLDELRTILLFEADHILMGAGPATAEHFIGFPTGDDDEYCGHPVSKVDLSRFPIAGSFDRGYEFAFRRSITNTLGDHEVQDLIVFMLGTPKAGGIFSGGATHPFMTPDGCCQTVADAVFARWKLEENSGGTFTTRELSLLADMTEGAVRNAMADRSDSGLRAVPGTKNPVLVEHQEAWRWLQGRRGFIPTPERPSSDRFLLEGLREVRSASSLGELIRGQLEATYQSVSDASSALAVDPIEVEAWISGNHPASVDQARRLAIALDLDIPTFVGKAIEVALRRDFSGSGQVAP